MNKALLTVSVTAVLVMIALLAVPAYFRNEQQHLNSSLKKIDSSLMRINNHLDDRILRKQGLDVFRYEDDE